MRDRIVERSWLLAAIGLVNLFVILTALALRKLMGLPHLCSILAICVALSLSTIVIVSKDESK